MTITPLTDLAFHHVLAQTAGNALVLVTAPDCGACHRLRVSLQQYQLEHALPIFEVDAVANSALVHELEIFHLPALFLYVGGQFHAELKTEALPQAIAQAITTALSQPAQDAP